MLDIMSQRLLQVILFFACVSVPLSLQSQMTFGRVYGEGQHTRVIKAIETQDGDYFLVGTTFRRGASYSDLWFMKTDPDGAPIWTQSPGTPVSEQVYDLLETRDGNFVILGSTVRPGKSVSTPWIFQVDRYGQVMWSHYLKEEWTDRKEAQLRALVQTQDGGFAAAGFTMRDKAKGHASWLLRLNAVGEVLWEHLYDTAREERATCLIETRDGGFVLGGYIEGPAVNGRDMLIIRTDRKGEALWQQVSRAAGTDRVEDLLETSEGTFLAVGWGTHTDNDSEARIWEVSRGGASRTMERFNGPGADVFYDIVETEEGYTALGRSNSQDESPDIWLVGLSKEGEMIWESFTRGTETDWAHGLYKLEDGGFLIAGSTLSFVEGNIPAGYFIKTDGRGRFGAAASGAMIGPSTAVTSDDDALNQSLPTLYLLSIGVSTYAEAPIDLQFAAEDARAISEHFLEQQGRLFAEVDVRLLTDETATYEGIMKGFDWLETASPDDMVLIFCSAHGARGPQDQFFLLPTDVSPRAMRSTAIDMAVLQQTLMSISAPCMLWLDACHSGQSAVDAFTLNNEGTFNQALQSGLPTITHLSFFTSSTGAEVSYEDPDWGHGAFTQALLEGLEGAADYNQDTRINLLELNLFVSQRVQDLTRGQQTPQMPLNFLGNRPVSQVTD